MAGRGGRPKGAINKKTAQLEDVAKRLKCDPFEILCHFANGDYKALGYEAECFFSEKPDGAVKMGYVISPDLRVHAAKEAIKYLHAQKKAVELSANPESGFKITVIDYSKKDEK